MNGSKGPRQLPLGAEVPLAFFAGVAAFAVIAIALAAIDSDAFAVVLGAVVLVGVAALIRAVGVIYAVPVAIAGLLAFDWFRFPPTHAHEFPPARDLGDLAAYLAVAVFVGALASRAGRRAEVTEAARSELADEQAALRRVATLVAQRVAPAEIFEAVAREVGQWLDVDAAHLGRYEADGAVTGVGSWSPTGDNMPAGTRVPVGGTNVTTLVKQSGRPARLDSYQEASGRAGDTFRELGFRSAVGAPIVVDGQLWGVMIASSKAEEPLPVDTESRIADFTELVATAVSNAEGWTEAHALTDEQAALRRVATLVAQAVPAGELFGAVAREVGTLLGADFSGMICLEDDATARTVAVWAAAGEHPAVPERFPVETGDPMTMIAETRTAARVDDWTVVPGSIAAALRDELGVRSSVGCPIVVDGGLWGALAVHSVQATPLPPGTESRIGQFTDLVATAIANAEARGEVERLADEQAALRRVATLVAQGAPGETLFSAVCDEVEALAGADASSVVRFEANGTVTVMGTHAARHPVGARLELDPDYVVAEVHRTGRSARFDTDDPAAIGIPEVVRAERVRSGLANPIVVEGQLWGAIMTASRERPLPAGMERRLADFTELVATAIANTLARQQVKALADEQAALRRVATLVAKESAPAEIFAKVAEEAAGVIGGVDCAVLRDEGDGTASTMAVWGAGISASFPPGTRMPVHGDGVVASVVREGRPHRIDNYTATAEAVAEGARERGIRSAVGCPIEVRGRVWGAMVVATYDAEPCAPETESRIAQFAELVATAIANADARAEVALLAAEQAALRRVATLVAEGASPTAVFDAAAAEMEGLLDAEQVVLSRYEPGNEVTVVAHSDPTARRVPPGTRISHEGENVQAMVRRSGRPARLEQFDEARGPLADLASSFGVGVVVAAPVIVEGRLWGVMSARWNRDESPPEDTEDRMARFARLLDTAIANADSHDQLTASRARLVAADDEARRRVVRDLHDGAQQRLVHAIVTLKLAQRAMRQSNGDAESLVGEALQHAERSNVELRELAHGILPSVLTRGGLRAGVEAVVTRVDLPVTVRLSDERFAPEIEASAYFIVAEALTNVVKHASARCAEVRASADDGLLRVEVRDDGVGGADPGGHGLVGMADRVTALGGRLTIDSPEGNGTRLVATLPL